MRKKKRKNERKLTLGQRMRIGFAGLMWGLRQGDKQLTGNVSDDAHELSLSGIEQQEEEENVLKDLQKGVVTEAVRELRHEMYFSERESQSYEYIRGEGYTKNKLFDELRNADIDRSDNLTPVLIQMNRRILEGVTTARKDWEKGIEKRENYAFTIKRDFFVRFQLEKFAQQIVVKRKNGDDVVIDFYLQTANDTTPLIRQFNDEVSRIVNGDKRSDVLAFDELSFISTGALGVPDLIEYRFDNFKFRNAWKYDDRTIISFDCHLKSIHDLVADFYHEPTAEKNKNKERRKSVSIEFNEALADSNETTQNNKDAALDIISKFKGETR